MSNPCCDDFCYVGDCPVCGEPVDESDAGYCGICGCSFHWSVCGGWVDSVHQCDKCKEWLKKESAK